ncbi:B3 domain-containing protein At1g49475-like [Vicia villosa]|uniref:B3 domain-containing protein At1g49475-like n=1 Tax=Vicia villosa TaxID=3911 RepID=UPI00273BEF6C|nr:B3 domain-containing protein At1g49475-like [Vicia villosa]
MASEIPLVEPIHFILTQSFHHQKFMMPCKFVKKYGKSLPKDIYLNTPNGEKWKIYLVKSDGKIWFGSGWKEFAKFHSLSYYHLLVFRYESTSSFEVQIFDKTASEINYPHKRIEAEKVSNSKEDCRENQKRKAYSSFEFGSSSCVKVRKSQNHIDKKRKGKPVTNAEKNTTLERAKELKTSNPYFVLVMGASYVEHHFLLTIPCEFGKRHFDLDKKKGDIYFQVLDHGLVWHAKYTIRMSTTGLKFELSRKWREFVKDNNLKVGDVCNFELIHQTNMTFQVHIFRTTDEVNTKCSTSQSRFNY